MHPILNLRDYLDILRREDELLEIDTPVDPHLEIAEIHSRVFFAVDVYDHNTSAHSFL